MDWLFMIISIGLVIAFITFLFYFTVAMFILGQKWIRTVGARYESAVYYGKFGGRKIAICV